MYDDDLDGALELVVRDLLTAGYAREKAERIVREQAEDRVNSVGDSAGGEIALQVADAIQEDIIEERDDHVWPRCPEHGTHPLWIAPMMQPTAMWRCHVSGTAFARLGELDGIDA